MASLYRKPCAETMREDGESGYQSDGYWNKYAERLDKCDFFAGCGKKNGAVNFCAIAYCYWLFVNVITDDGYPSDDDRKYFVHYAMYQSDRCCTSAGCEQQVQVYKDHGAWHTNPKDLVVGDQIFFQKWDSDKGRMVYYHTGGCYDWDDVGVYVTEANVEGGKTKNRFYPYSEFGKKIAGFGHPRFDGYELETSKDDEPISEPDPIPEPEPDPEPDPEPTTEQYRVYTNGSYLRLRAEPNTDSEVLACIPNGTIIDVSEIVEGEMIDWDCNWAKTTFDGETGYCSCRWLDKL